MRANIYIKVKETGSTLVHYQESKVFKLLMMILVSAIVGKATIIDVKSRDLDLDNLKAIKDWQATNDSLNSSESL